MADLAAGVSTRRYASTQEPVPAAHRPRAASKSALSRCFVQLSQEQLAQWLACPLGELDLAVVMIDGIHFRDRVILLALGIDTQGNKHVLGLREDSAEASRVVASLLSDLVDRGLDAHRTRLWVIDGGKALRQAIVQTFGTMALSSVARFSRNVKRWGDGQMVLRWVASALSHAATRMRKLCGSSQTRSLLKALDARRADAGILRKAA